jgi:hypothetical protein
MSVLYGTSPVCITVGREEGPTVRSFLTVSVPQENSGFISRRVFMLRISILLRVSQWLLCTLLNESAPQMHRIRPSIKIGSRKWLNDGRELGAGDQI